MRREKMIAYRKSVGASIQQMARKCKCSVTLLRMIEGYNKEVTHPNIAERIGRAYRLTDAETEMLMPEHYRKSSPNYNPDLYKYSDLL